MADDKLIIDIIISEAFQENAYILHGMSQGRCVVIDPGLEPEAILNMLDAKSLVPDAILDTHGHADHIAGNRALKDRWPDCPIMIGEHDADKLTDPVGNLSASFLGGLTSPAADRKLTDGETFTAAGIELHVDEIPGHTRGHVVFRCKSGGITHVFVGDVIFAGSVGRSDFPDGDHDQLINGIHQKLYTMPDDTVLYPGHGPTTTVGAEKRTNPYT